MAPSSPTQPVPEGALRTPASKRISSPASQRLATITESSNANGAPPIVPPIPPRSILRNSTSSLSLSIPQSFKLTPPWASQERETSIETTRTAPPAYEWIPEPLADDSRHDPNKDEKLAALRGPSGGSKRQRGGWRRLVLLAAVVLLIIVGLAVGLGVGLTVGRHRSNETSSSNSTSGSNTGAQPFPLGGFSFLTTLSNTTTSCTSNPSTWSCYPPTTGSPAIFNWILTNTSSTYATINSPQWATSNLTISSTDNPFGVTFSNQPLTYTSGSSNARYTFTFQMSKSVFPSTPLTNDGSATQCFYNQTTFTGTLYLSKSRTYPAENANISGVSYSQWPYAVEVSQSSNGGDGVPSCYEYINGATGNRITTGFTATAADSQCLCDYRNF